MMIIQQKSYNSAALGIYNDNGLQQQTKMSILILSQVFWVISVLVTWQWPLRRSRSFKVTEFGTNRKLICDFLLVN